MSNNTVGMKFKVGDRVKIIKYKNVQIDGIITKIDPTMSANGKRVISNWYVIKYLETIDYYCEKDDLGLFTKSDLMKVGVENGRSKKT